MQILGLALGSEGYLDTSMLVSVTPILSHVAKPTQDLLLQSSRSGGVYAL